MNGLGLAPVSDDEPNRVVESEPSPVEAAALYFPSCGVLCDAFWWARSKREPAPSTADPKKAQRERPCRVRCLSGTGFRR